MRRPAHKAIAVALLLVFLPAPGGAQFNKLKKIITRTTDTFKPWTPEQEEEIGRAGAAKMIAAFKLYEDPQITRYVNLAGLTVAQEAERDVHYHFGILNTAMVNAFALPGGYIFVTRGALLAMKNEAELAGVLAHEVAHVDGRHLEKAVRKKKAKQWAWDEASEKIPPSAVKQIADDLVGELVVSRPDPGQESEADKDGTEFAAQAGYRATGLRDFLETLAEAAGDARNKRALAAFNGTTHPPLAERVAALTRLTEKYGTEGETLERRFAQNMAPEPRVLPAKVTTTTTTATEGKATITPPQKTTKTTAAAGKGTGTLYLNSTPDGADIFVDNNFVGQTPSTLRLPAGRRVIKVIKEGHQPWTRALNVLADSELRLNATLGK